MVAAQQAARAPRALPGRRVLRQVQPEPLARTSKAARAGSQAMQAARAGRRAPEDQAGLQARPEPKLVALREMPALAVREAREAREAASRWVAAPAGRA